MPTVPLGQLLAMVGGMATLLVYGYFAYRKQAWKQVDSTHVALGFFLLGSMAFWMSIFPPTLDDAIEPAPVSGIGLGIAGALFTPAVAVAIFQLRNGRQLLTRLNVLFPVLVFGMSGFAMWSNTPAGQSLGIAGHMRSVMLLFGGFAVAMVLLFVAGLWLHLRFHTGNRMARLINAGRHDEAIQLGEAIPALKREPVVLANLISAYSGAGRHEQALALAETIPADQPDHVMLITLANVYHAAGRHPEALAFIEQVQPQENWPPSMTSYVDKLDNDIRAAVGAVAASR